jgi:hypothetical protein
MTRKSIAGVFAVLVGTAALPYAGTAAQAEDTYLIHGGVWDYCQSYLDKIGHGVRPGAFAITTDGLGAAYSWCPDQRCRASGTYSGQAKQSCEQSYDTDCVVFAIRDEIKVPYEIYRP